MKKAFLLCLCAFAFLPHPSLAHSKESDGNIEVTFYVEPHQAVEAGNEVKLVFKFKDSLKPFDAQGYALRVEVKEGDSIILAKDIASGDVADQVLRVPVVFPYVGNFALTITGISKEASHESFAVRYAVNVGAAAIADSHEGMKHDDHAPVAEKSPIFYILAGVILCGAVVYAIVRLK